jgi:predicted nucleotide-binding protein
MSHSDELRSIASALNDAANGLASESVAKPLKAVEKAAKEIGKSSSGSWLGYHARVYYVGFTPPPPGVHFSQEWGLKEVSGSGLGSRGNWREFSADQVTKAIQELSQTLNLDDPRNAAEEAERVFRALSADVLSILETELGAQPDSYLSRLKGDLEKLKPVSQHEITQAWAPKGERMTRDMIAVGQGNQVPPHLATLARVAAIRHAFDVCKSAAEISNKVAAHLRRKSTGGKAAGKAGTYVVIGHGGSNDWRELKDFVQDRLKLACDEFNRVPVAGITNVARLSQMLDAAAFALLVMTAEDEMNDGTFQPRLNVVHESGLFQGRLGFTKAIVLLEDGCAQFSNIEGLGQIRFPKGKIAASFEEVRRVLEREGLL